VPTSFQPALIDFSMLAKLPNVEPLDNRQAKGVLNSG
jgi:hypothetical protein